MPAKVCALAALVASAVLVGASARPDTITVSAAVSLTDALEAAGAAYTSSRGDVVRFNFAGSNVLARQIVSGAPVDLFISADEEQMSIAQRGGGIDAKTRVPLLTNRLVLVTGLGATLRIDTPDALRDPGVRRIALGDPAAVPAGVYAKRYLETIGLWAAVEPKCVPVANVRAALAAAANGSADAAFVYETDARTSTGVTIAFTVSGPAAPRIVYPAALTTRAPHREAAARFLAWLQDGQAQRVFESRGFRPVPREAR